MVNTKILIYDIETSYTVGATWGIWEQNVNYVFREPYIISFAYKWYGERKTHVLALPDFKNYKTNPHDDKELMQEMWKLFDEAEAIVAHNGVSFDDKWVRGRFIANGMTPPSPTKSIDTKRIAKSTFKFNSNSLNNLAKYLGIGQKLETGGFQLWVDCIEHQKKKSWDRMKKYNRQDVVLLEKVYKKMLPWIKNHPNRGLIEGKSYACTNCGSKNVQRRGYNYTKVGKYQRVQCQDCGTWSQERRTQKVDVGLK